MELRGPTLLNSPEVAAFGGFLDALESILVGANYSTGFAVKAFGLPGKQFPMSEMMLLAYPESKPHEAFIKKCDLEILREITDPIFSYPDTALLETRDGQWVLEQLRQKFWRHLRHCIDYENSAIYSYNSDVGMPGYWVYWKFAWLIHHKAQKRGLLLYGYSTD